MNDRLPQQSHEKGPAIALAFLMLPLLYTLLLAGDAVLHPTHQDPASVLFVGPSSFLRRCLILGALFPAQLAAAYLLPERAVVRVLPLAFVFALGCALFPIGFP